MSLSASSFILCFSGVLYCTKNKMHNILFIKKPKNPINEKKINQFAS
jgi:hypothetical protein